MSHRARDVILRYGCAVVSNALAIWLRLLLDPVLGREFPFATLYLAVLITAWYGGFRPALMSVVLGAVASKFFLMPPRWSFELTSSDQQMGLILYTFTGLGIALLAGSMHFAERALRKANEQLESRVLERTAELANSNDRLSASEERFRLIVEGVNSHAIFRLDPSGIIQTWNPGAERIKGYKPEEIIGQHFSCFYSPGEIASGKPQRELEIAIADGFYEEEGLRIRKDGSQFWAIVTITPMYDGCSQPIGFIKVTHDITKRKQAEILLRETENRMAFALQKSKTGAWELDTVNRTAHRTLEHAQIFGYESILPKWSYELFLDHVFPDDRAEVDRRFHEAIATQTDWELECRIRRADGEVRWIWVVGGHQRDALGKSQIIGGIVQDITPRKLAEIALRAERDRFEQIVSAVPVVICSYLERPDGTSRFPFANPAIEQIYGVRPEDLAKDASPIFNRMHPDDGGWIRATLDESARTLTPWRGEFRVRNPSRGEIWVEGHVIPSAESDGGILWQGYIADITERKRAEAVLQDRERMLGIVTETARVGLVVVGKDYRYQFANRAYTDIFELDADRIVGNYVWEVLPAGWSQVQFELDADRIVGRRASETSLAGWSQIQSRMDRALAGESVEYEMELPARSTSEGPRYYSIVYQPRADEKGEPTVVVVVVDISVPKRAEEAVRKSEARFRGAFQHTNVAMVITDIENRFLQTNKAFAQLFGYTEEEILNSSLASLTHPDHIAESLLRREVLMAGEADHFEMEKRYLRKDGSVIWGLTNVSLLRDQQGRPHQYVGQVQDITERKRADEARNLFRALLDRSNDAIEVIDLDTGGFLDANETAYRSLGYTREEYLALSVADTNPSIAVSGWAGFAQELRRARSIILETQHRRKDGSTFPVEVNAILTRLDREYSVAVVRDITEKKKLEAQLQQSQKMDAFGQLAGGVAHDFNNLLTVISGYSDMLLKTLPPDDANREMVGEIRHAGERAASLTRQLLAFSRKQVLEPRVLDLNAIITDTEKMLCRLIGEDIRFTTVLSPGIRSVKVDPGQIEQVIMNLVVNARDAMPRGGMITVETNNVELDESYAATHVEVRPGRFVTLAVSDTGTGMTPEVKARLFEPFFTTKGVGKGTGLGLAVVQGIVKQSQGSIEVYSEVGTGTTFKVFLPAVQERSMSVLAPSLVNAPSGGETILLVEDEDGVRKFATFALEGFGYRVLAATVGEGALETMASYREKIDLLVTDVVMPGMSGRELAEIIQAKYPDLKVLFMSGYTDDSVVRHGILQANVAFLQKPFTSNSLASKVREVLDQV